MPEIHTEALPSADWLRVMEREYFAEKVESPAAVVHKLILANGISCLDEENRRSWARFLLAQVVRTPDKVAHVRSVGSQLMDDLAVPDVLEKLSIPQSHKSAMYKFLVNNAPDFAGNYSLAHMPSAIEAQLNNDKLLSANWLLRRIKNTTVPLLISDRPIIYVGKIQSEFLIALPISPFDFFIAASNPNMEKYLNRYSDKIFSTKVNCSTVYSADRYIYARDESHSKFVKRLFTK